MDALRIVALVPGDTFSGPAGQVASTAAVLAKLDVEVRFLLLRRPHAATGQLPAFLHRHGLQYEVLDDHSPLDPRLALRVDGLLRRWSPAIVETHGYKPSAIAFLLRLGRPTWRWVGFFHGHTTESRRARVYHWVDLRLLAFADCAVTISNDQRRRLPERLRRAYVVPSAVPIVEQAPRGAAGTRTIPDPLDPADRPRIGVIGRLSPEKGVDLFLGAAALLRAKGVNFSAAIVGDGPERDHLEQYAGELGLRGQVRFLGHVSAMFDVYHALDLVVIPSRSEGLPSVLLEALSADVPVVGTRVGAIPQVLSEPESGILVEAGSAEALAAGIEAALASLRGDASRQARARVAGAFSQERRAETMLRIYHDVLHERVRSK